MVPPDPPCLGRYQMPGTPATALSLLARPPSERTTGGSTTPHRSSRTISTERNSSMGSDDEYPMKVRMASRVTATARLWGRLPSPAHGRRNGTRAMAADI